jgi:LmbE family N-acetylglucosaminyl deacetylase
MKQSHIKTKAERPLIAMKSYYHSIYLSPHLDDVAFSCGGQVFMQTAKGRMVLIVTVMAGDRPGRVNSKYIQELHDRWQLESDVVARRRAEDSRACRILGADHLYWDFPDCIYRFDNDTNEPLYLSDEDIFGEIHSSDFYLINALSNQILKLPMHDHLFVPLGVGNHVDHQLTRQAVGNSASLGVSYYEEFPYADDPQVLLATNQLAQNLWQATAIPLSEAALEAKIKAIASYESQLSTFFHDRADMEEAVRRYTISTGGERIWRRIDGS